MTAAPVAESSYRSGDWFGVFGARGTVLLPPEAKGRAATLWELADADADFDELLDGLIAGGLRDLASFALVSSGEEPTRVLARGEITVTLRLEDGSDVAVDGRAAATWVERTVAHVTGVDVVLGDGGDQELVIGSGLVRVSRITRPPTAKQAPAAPPGPPPPVPPVGVSDQTTEVLPSTSTPAVPPPPDSGPRPVARLLFSHGHAVEVDQPVLVGRAPDPGRLDGDQEPVVVKVPSPNQEISATHVVVRPGTGDDEGVAVLVDLGSTNGTLVVLPGQPPEELEPRVPVRLEPGAVIDLGDGLTIHVTGL